MGPKRDSEDQSTSFSVEEKGEIYFFFKPKVGVAEPHSGDDVQRMFLVLRPQAAEKEVEEKQSSEAGKEGHLKEARESDEGAAAKKEGTEAQDEEEKVKKDQDTEEVEIGEKPLFRYIVMGRKSLPDAAKGTSRPYWGFVELVTTNPEDLKKMLSQEEYDTKTRGHRVNPAARPVGEGRYSIVRHHRGGNRQATTHLAYKLELPGPHKKHHDPQDAMNIEPQASFVIQVKNPKQAATPAPAQAANKRRAVLPAHLLGELGPQRFVPLDPPDLLNYEGVELLLISTRDELLDAEVDAELETSDSLTKDVPDLMELVVSEKEHEKLIRPLLEGVWA